MGSDDTGAWFERRLMEPLSSSRKSLISGDSEPTQARPPAARGEAERAERRRPREEASGRGLSNTSLSLPKYTELS